jgi:general L-amino acid transport system permease protein
VADIELLPDAGKSSTRTPIWRNVRFLRVAAQVAALTIVALLIRWLLGNLFDNLERQGLPTGFDFLDSPSGFVVRDSPFSRESPVRHLIWLGVRNTLAVSLVGIVFALIIGTLVGIGRLSSNWMVRKLATLYVETFRNIPVLVIIIFFGSALFTFGPLPAFSAASPPKEIGVPGFDGNFAILSKSRLGFLSIASRDGAGTFWIVMLVALVAAIAVWIWRTKVNERTGQPHRRVLYSFGLLLAVAVVAFIALGGPLTWSTPQVSESGRTIIGGIATNDGYMSITFALAIYTASHIAEIVRGSILAVPKGQNEAANALAFNGFQRYRFIVLPQAMRIAVPSIINQFLNLTKNSSLAVAVAYPDLTSVLKTAIGNGNPAPQIILVLMACYLTFSLVISFVLNLVNNKMQVAGR